MNTTFEMGPLQKQWVADLRKYPERQVDCELGYKTANNTFRACCLGQLLITDCEMNNKEIPLNQHGRLFDKKLNADGYLDNSYEEYGLFSEKGKIEGGNLKGHSNLGVANDEDVSWIEIADFIEANPEKIFTKSV